MGHENIIILDFGSQYTQLIAKSIRKFNVYCTILPCNASYETILTLDPKAVILSGSPFSVNDPNAPFPDVRIFDLKVPLLGICYGMQFLAKHFGGHVHSAEKKEYGSARLIPDVSSVIFQGLEPEENVWMSHGDSVEVLPEGFRVIGRSDNTSIAAMESETEQIYALQFHPEVVHTVHGQKILRNFCFQVVQCKGDWTTESFIESTVTDIRKRVGTKRVILGLSGGVDSSVAAALLYKAIGSQLIPIFVDTGLLRKNEAEDVESIFREGFGMDLDVVKAADIFLSRLEGITEPEEKRKIIGRTFIDIFDQESGKFDEVSFLAQGTLYPDVIESVSFKGPSSTIKSHHNVGGLPDKMKLELIEPLRELFKDEVRALGKELGLPDRLVWRHPFPGPGLAVRILGAITREKVALLQDVDNIFIEELYNQNLYHQTWQAFAVLLPVRTVGVMGDERTYDYVCALRAVNSEDGMTADWTAFPEEFLRRVSNRISNEVKGINRVVYDISSKPPATIEWE